MLTSGQLDKELCWTGSTCSGCGGIRKRHITVDSMDSKTAHMEYLYFFSL